MPHTAHNLTTTAFALLTLVLIGAFVGAQSDGNEADDDASEDLEGDEREHAIVTPTLTILHTASVGLPEKAIPEALNQGTFDRALAVKIAAIHPCWL